MPIQEMPVKQSETQRPNEIRAERATSPEISRKSSRKLWFYAMGAILVAAIAAFAYRATAKPAPAAWTAVPVQRNTVTKSISATGKLDALTTVNVGSQVSGTLA